MFLQDIKNELPQLGYAYLPTLERIKKINIENIDGRLELLFEILKYSDSLSMRPIEGKTLFNPRFIQEKLNKATTYKREPKMVGFNLGLIVTALSFEIKKENSNEFDFTMIKDILSGKKKHSDFIITPENVGINNKVWSFKGASGVEHSGQGLGELMKLNTIQCIDLVKGMQEEDVIEYINSNEELIKKQFANKRNAYISFLKNKIDENYESKFLALMNK